MNVYSNNMSDKFLSKENMTKYIKHYLVKIITMILQKTIK